MSERLDLSTSKDIIDSEVADHIQGDTDDALQTAIGEVESKIAHLQERQKQFAELDSSRNDAHLAITQAASDLIAKIKDHENRLLDELDTRRETEFKKLGFNHESLKEAMMELTKILNEGKELLSNKNTHNRQEHESTLARLHGQGLPEALSTVEDLPPVRKLYFEPIRCNTAFGSIYSPRENNISDSTSNKQNNRERAISILQNIPPSGLRASPVLSLQQPHMSTEEPPMSRKKALMLLGSSTGSNGEFNRNRSRSYHGHPSSPKKPMHSAPSPLLMRALSERVSRANTPVLLWQINAEGNGPGEINCPNDVAFLPDGNIVVSDRDNARLQIFDQYGNFSKIIAQGKIKPRRLAITKDGNIAVSDARDNQIKIYNIDGHCISSWGKKLFKSMFKSPCGLAVMSQGQYVVSDMERHTVGIYQPDGKYCKPLGLQADFHSPSYITVDGQDRIIISDNWTHAVKVYDNEGSLLFQFSKLRHGEGNLKYPNGVCVDSQGQIYVGDWGKHSLLQFQSDGTFLRHVLTRDDNLRHPAGIAVNSQNQIIISEYSESHSSIRMFQLYT